MARHAFDPLTSKRRVFFIELYPDSESYNCNDLLKVVESFSEYAYILHDMDVKIETGEMKKPHYHCVIRTNPSLLSTIQNKFKGLSSQFIEVSHEFKWCIRYLVHLDDSEKFQYPQENIHSNISDLLLYLRVQPEWFFVNEMINLRADGKPWKEIFNYSCQNGCYDVFRRNLGIIQLVSSDSFSQEFKDTEYFDIFD